jgi:uncharacterized iron-regulated membrane protein
VKIFFRKLHRWLGLLIAVQIVAWMLSGFYFSLFPIEEIRGEHLTRGPETLDRARLELALPPAQAITAVDRHMGRDWTLESMSLYPQQNKTFWRVEGTADEAPFARLVDLKTGRVRQPLSAEQALERAQGLLLEPGRDPRVEWIEEAPGNMEFRGRALPVWGVAYTEPESIRLYIDPWTGELLARRTDRWRIFDFLWMLHVMDYETRDDFNHPLIQVAALSGLLVALGGVILWALTTRLFRRRRRGT